MLPLLRMESKRTAMYNCDSVVGQERKINFIGGLIISI
jgi:hypothetical protein